MTNSSLSVTRLIHENISIVMCYVYSRSTLNRVIHEFFPGEWPYLNKALFQISKEQAEKAVLELALYLRTLDDGEDITGYHRAVQRIPDCGRVFNKPGKDRQSEERLHFREAANKIIHSSWVEWDVSKEMNPLLICHATEKQWWTKAEVELLYLAGVCGQIIS